MKKPLKNIKKCFMILLFLKEMSSRPFPPKSNYDWNATRMNRVREHFGTHLRQQRSDNTRRARLSCTALFKEYEDLPADILAMLDEEAIREAMEEMDEERRRLEQEEMEQPDCLFCCRRFHSRLYLP